jgi:hypothetical protein
MKRIGRIHAVIPDCQVRPDVNTDYLKWVGEYLAEKRPDVIVQIGDFADMASLNGYGKKIEMEKKRYKEDAAAVKEAMAKLMKPIRKAKKYQPELILTLGNHEERIDRAVADDPTRLAGTISTYDLGYEEAGWTVVPFLRPVRVDDIEYCHYFVSGAMGRPVSSAAALLKARHGSAVMGHVQHFDMAVHPYTGHIGMFAGICYTHDEDYLTPQGNNTRRQIVMLHEVRNGIADPCLVSLEFLKRKYS